MGRSTDDEIMLKFLGSNEGVIDARSHPYTIMEIVA